jgi:uncharacterized protein (TIGR03067 family)
LTGWEARRCALGTWKVENGILIGRDAPYGELVTDHGTFENYQLRLEARINAGGDSGVYNRFSLQEDGSGYEVQIGCHDAPRPHTGAVLWTGGGQRDAGVKLTRPDVWFTLEIVVQDNRVVTIVNGTPTVDCLDPDRRYRKGHIVLQLLKNTVVEFRKIEIKELPPTKTAELAPPFVILAKDAKAERTFATLAEAVAAAQAGDTIEIRGDGPFVTKPILLQKKALTIRAGHGALPILRLAEGDVGPLLDTDAPLALEGLNLQAGLASAKAGRGSLIFVRTGPLSAANCRFTAGLFWRAIMLSDTLSCRLHNCAVLGADLHVAIEWECPPGGRLVVENCALLTRYHGLMFHQRKGFDKEVAVYMRRNTLLSDMPINYWCQAPVGDVLDGIAKKNHRPLRLEIEECIFDPYWHVVDFRQVDQAQALDLKAAQAALPKLLTWNGRGNLYPASNRYLFLSAVRDNAESQPWATAPEVLRLSDWTRFWGNTETGAVEGRILFQGGNLAAKARPDAERLQANDFRLPPGSAGKGAGPGGKDLGADVDLVGPCPAYEKWKQTKGYQQWLKDSGQVKAEQPAADLERLQGTWVITSFTVGGRAGPGPQGDTLTIDGDKFTLAPKTELMKGTVKIDPTQKPKAIDLDVMEGGKKGVALCIYALEGDELKLSFAEPGVKERPTELGSKTGTGHIFATLKRKKN